MTTVDYIFLSALNCLPLTMTRMLEQVQSETGLVGTVLLGGPEPKQGGKIIVMRCVVYS
jgi:hypothetical protein